MDFVLTPVEIRVLGCLIEKEATTPDTYPLSLNALTSACNQKTNRDPVMSLSEGTVLEAVESLVTKTLVSARSGAGSRVEKYAHRLTDRLRPAFDFDPPQLALMGLLFLRGPQTPGELKQRCGRLHAFRDTGELTEALERLARREDGPYVVRLPRQPGQKESRYAQLAGGPVHVEASAGADAGAVVDDGAARLAALEVRVEALAAELESLAARFESFAKQFDP